VPYKRKKDSRFNSRDYYRRTRRHLGVTGPEKRDRGAAGEHFVISELLRQQLQVGGPYNQNGKHDLFVKVSDKWYTIQVTLSQVNLKTGTILLTGRNRSTIVSDLIALVDLEGKRIRWVSNTKEPVPKELLRD
jgi:hypothetical protein